MFESVQLLEAKELTVTGVTEAATDDWDHYESRCYRAIAEWARANPDHPQRAEFVTRNAEEKRRYFEFWRDYLGWAIFVCRLPD